MLSKWINYGILYHKENTLLLSCMFLLLAVIPAHAATVTTNYTYDNIGRLTSTSYTHAAGVSSLNYTYDAAGNMLASTSTVPTGTNQPPAPTAPPDWPVWPL